MCPRCKLVDAVIRKGFFAKKSTRTERVQRYFCKICRRHFSDQTGTLTYRERKPHLDQPLFRLLVNGVSQRACAKILGCHKNTVDRKLCRLGIAAHERMQEPIFQEIHETEVIFDEMETFEHTKCKPIAIALAVAKKSRKIIAVEAASMPAKGKLAATARRKYGLRRDDRPQALDAMASSIKTFCSNLNRLFSDQCPRYPKLVASHFPGVKPVGQSKGSPRLRSTPLVTSTGHSRPGSGGGEVTSPGVTASNWGRAVCILRSVGGLRRAPAAPIQWPYHWS